MDEDEVLVNAYLHKTGLFSFVDQEVIGSSSRKFAKLFLS